MRVGLKEKLYFRNLRNGNIHVLYCTYVCNKLKDLLLQV